MTHTIVIVEDEMDLARLLTDILESVGYSVVLTTGSQAIDCIAAVQPSAVVVDYSMPGLDGGAVIRGVRDKVPNAPAMILVTGMTNARDLAETLGADAFLRKPFDVENFVDLVNRLARVHRV